MHKVGRYIAMFMMCHKKDATPSSHAHGDASLEGLTLVSCQEHVVYKINIDYKKNYDGNTSVWRE